MISQPAPDAVVEVVAPLLAEFAGAPPSHALDPERPADGALYRAKAVRVIEAVLPVLLAGLQPLAPDRPELVAQCADGGHSAYEPGADRCHCGSRRFLAGGLPLGPSEEAKAAALAALLERAGPAVTGDDGKRLREADLDDCLRVAYRIDLEKLRASTLSGAAARECDSPNDWPEPGGGTDG